MATANIERTRWGAYFDEMARLTRGSQVYVESASGALGNQIETEWLPLTGITYDPKDDVLDVITDEVDHMINHPRAISVDYDTAGLHNVSVVDSEGHTQIIRLKEPTPLPTLM